MWTKFANHIRVLRKMICLPSWLLKEIYFNYVATNLGHLGIPHMTYCISSVSVFMVTEMDRIIHKQITLDCDAFERINWQDLVYLYIHEN